jgi:probable HAF family extracellular repeat protein
MVRVALIVAAILSCVLSAAPARAFDYTIVDLGTLTQTNLNQYSAGYDINDQGQVTGLVFDGSAGQHPYLWDGGPMQDIGSLGGGFGRGDGISYRAALPGSPATTLITGSSNLPNSGPSHAFLYQNGSFTDLGALPGINDGSLGEAVNPSGTVVGASIDDASHFRPTVWPNGTPGPIDIGDLGGGAGSAWDLNAAGLVVGASKTAFGVDHPFSWDGIKLKDLGTFGGNLFDGQARGVNDLGQIVGSASGPDGNGGSFSHAALWQTNATIVDLGTSPLGSSSLALDINDAGVVVGTSNGAMVWTQTNGMRDLIDLIQPNSGWTQLWAAEAINQDGWIVGLGMREDFPREHGFLLVPVPEPGTACLLALGLAAIGTRRKRLQREAQ